MGGLERGGQRAERWGVNKRVGGAGERGVWREGVRSEERGGVKRRVGRHGGRRVGRGPGERGAERVYICTVCVCVPTPYVLVCGCVGSLI